ncbi:TPA: hypothetical protein ACGF6U_002568 [Vibrio cholerae]
MNRVLLVSFWLLTLFGCSSEYHVQRYLHSSSAEYLLSDAEMIKEGKLELSVFEAVQFYQSLRSKDGTRVIQHSSKSILVDNSPNYQFLLTYRQCTESERHESELTPCIISYVNSERELAGDEVNVRSHLDMMVLHEFTYLVNEL